MQHRLPSAGGSAASQKSVGVSRAQQAAHEPVTDYVHGLSAPAAPYVYGSQTSKDAAWAALRMMPRARHEVWCAIALAEQGGLTDEEIAAAIPMNPSTVRPRRIELEKAGWIEAAPFTRATKADRQAQVYVAITPSQRAEKHADTTKERVALCAPYPIARDAGGYGANQVPVDQLVRSPLETGASRAYNGGSGGSSPPRDTNEPTQAELTELMGGLLGVA